MAEPRLYTINGSKGMSIASRYILYDYALWCEVCGEVWAVLRCAPGTNPIPSRTRIHSMPCDKHDGGELIPDVLFYFDEFDPTYHYVSQALVHDMLPRVTKELMKQ